MVKTTFEATYPDGRPRKFVGMHRPAMTLNSVAGYIQCSCGTIIQTVQQYREHWQSGHFDWAMYADDEGDFEVSEVELLDKIRKLEEEAYHRDALNGRLIRKNERLIAALPSLVQALRNIKVMGDTAIKTHADSALNDARVVAALKDGVGDTAA